MLREPNLCGGIYHVISAFKSHAANYQRLIVAEIEQHGEPIDKVRCGYFFEEVTGIKNPAVEKWASLAQRGGSRKLDPTAEYSPVYSEKWCLSINAEI